MPSWTVERVVHFAPGDFVRGGLTHFGFRDRAGRLIGIAHPRHFLGLVDGERVAWTMGAKPVFDGVPNIAAELVYPMYADALPGGAIVVSNLGNARLYRVDEEHMRAEVLVEGHAVGMKDMGNAVVDDEGTIWVNEVEGSRLWRFAADGRPLLTLGDGSRGFQRESARFDEVRFGWIYDVRRGPAGEIYVLDATNYALRLVDIGARVVRTIAGDGVSGYRGDGGDAREARFGGDPTARFDGPYSLSVDETGNAFVGDRFNGVVRMIERATGTIATIAGRPDADDEVANDPSERDPWRLNLPRISSMDYHAGRLYVPTDLSGDRGDLAVLVRS